ncbi:ABC transporter permease [Pseudarthrobacter sp. O4]|uniref:ABC transporter permease n=1 Tax=Pseudarthrobacter sp. O4 TaxID=3418417 RepID=UPI003CF69B90
MKRAATETNSLSRFNDSVDSAWTRVLGGVSLQGGVKRMLVLLVIAFAVFAALKPSVFLSGTNLSNIALNSPEIGVIAIAMMLAMLTGGIDLSLVATANLAAITMSTIFTAVSASDPALAEQAFPLILMAGIAVGVVGGCINGLLISVVGITPILATLGTMQIFNGIAVAWTGGKTLNGTPAALTSIGASTLGGIPTLFFVFVLLAIAIGVIINRTPLGLKIQLQGANPTAARYSGIASQQTLMSTYVLTGLLSGIAGVFFIARNPTASADYGASYVLLVIVIAVLGGTNPNGGFATVLGVVLATLTLQIVSSGFTALRLSSYQYAIAQGLVLVAAMAFEQVRWRRRRRQIKPAVQPT